MGDVLDFRRKNTPGQRTTFNIELGNRSYRCSIGSVDVSLADASCPAHAAILLLYAGGFELQGKVVPMDELMKFSPRALIALSGLVVDGLMEKARSNARGR